MSIISNYWELSSFCYTHGRVIPHTKGDSVDFTKFHCADKQHDDSENVICSEGIGTCKATLVGILSMKGIVVEFEDKDEYLLCTRSEFAELKKISDEEKKKRNNRQKKELNEGSTNPARPAGVKITRDIMDISYKAYEQCTDYPVRMMVAKSRGYLTPPYFMGDNSYISLLCKEDCLFPSCPFYDRRLFDELRHNHRSDYHEWVLNYMKNLDNYYTSFNKHTVAHNFAENISKLWTFLFHQTSISTPLKIFLD